MPDAITVTLAEIRNAGPCLDGWMKWLETIGDDHPDDKPFSLAVVLDSTGLDGALWVLDNVVDDKRIRRAFAADCAEQVLPIFEAAMPGDTRPRDAIAVARDPAATDAQRVAARAAAGAAARAAEEAAARAAAWAAAWAPAGAAARVAEWSAVGTAARAAAAARAAVGAAQSLRIRQYIEHGEAAGWRRWPDAKEED